MSETLIKNLYLASSVWSNLMMILIKDPKLF